MTKKTHGQRAYEAYCQYSGWKSLISGTALPQWDKQKPDVRDAWEKSAGEVLSFQADDIPPEPPTSGN